MLNPVGALHYVEVALDQICHCGLVARRVADVFEAQPLEIGKCLERRLDSGRQLSDRGLEFRRGVEMKVGLGHSVLVKQRAAKVISGYHRAIHDRQIVLGKVELDQAIQGYADGVFWERNTLAYQAVRNGKQQEGENLTLFDSMSWRKVSTLPTIAQS